MQAIGLEGRLVQGRLGQSPVRLGGVQGRLAAGDLVPQPRGVEFRQQLAPGHQVIVVHQDLIHRAGQLAAHVDLVDRFERSGGRHGDRQVPAVKRRRFVLGRRRPAQRVETERAGDGQQGESPRAEPDPRPDAEGGLSSRPAQQGFDIGGGGGLTIVQPRLKLVLRLQVGAKRFGRQVHGAKSGFLPKSGLPGRFTLTLLKGSEVRSASIVACDLAPTRALTPANDSATPVLREVKASAEACGQEIGHGCGNAQP